MREYARLHCRGPAGRVMRLRYEFAFQFAPFALFMSGRCGPILIILSMMSFADLHVSLGCVFFEFHHETCPHPGQNWSQI